MRIGLIDVDGHNFPNLPLMKLSAWHKQQGDSVEWYRALLHGYPLKPLDKVYMSKVFSFSPDYPYYINAKEIIKGGSGYAIHIDNGLEVYDKEKDCDLPYEVEHIYPDYSLYPEQCKDTAYGFLTRGCPRGCSFCHVSTKEGRCSYKVADLTEFWKGQKNIVLCDPNLIVCQQWKELIQQLIDSKAKININQGIDIRVMTEEKAELIKQLRVDSVHFAWDRYEDKDFVLPKLKAFKDITGWGSRKTIVYVLTNFNTTIDQDLERIYIIRDLGYDPYVMIYNKDDFIITDKNGKPIRLKPMDELLKKYTLERTRHFDICWDIQRWVNNRKIFKTIPKFENYSSKLDRIKIFQKEY